LAFALIFGFLAPRLPVADSLAHFRFHLTIAMALVALVLFVARDWRAGGIACAVALAGFVGLAPAFPLWRAAASGGPAPSITLVQLNLSFRNRRPEAVADFIRAEGADVVTLQEVTRNTGRVIELLGDDYPHRVRCPFARVGGVAVLSRLPRVPGPSEGCVEGEGLAWLRVMADGRPVSVASVHLQWPYPFGQAPQIDRLQARLQSIPRPVLLAGDFNAAPWSHAVGRVAAATETEVAGGLRFTFQLWPGRWAPSIGMPIDHVLLPAGISPTQVRLGPGLGSDHRSLVARLALPPGPKTGREPGPLVQGPVEAK
jgi:endonuclease/exonuclease/phosphatase (EEP) superfamily protein YafD